MSTNSEIIFTQHIGETLSAFMKNGKYSKIIILVDENTRKYCLPHIKEATGKATVIEIKSGEEAKNLDTCTQIWATMTEQQLDRKALFINLGGGVIGDMGGFCAATYKRGIDFIQIPTTLLSQVDASVGGKLGIDFMGLKNHIGVFEKPLAVLISTKFLSSLPAAEIRSGYAEIIKHCLIADVEKWKDISATPYSDLDWDDLARHSVKIKSQVTDEDPLEKGLRKILNFGHTIGHAVESHFLPQSGKKLLHGEAIAIGMIAEAYLAKERSFISESDLNQIASYLVKIYGAVFISAADIEAILPLTLQDKKNEHNTILCTLLEQVGKANYNQEITLDEIRLGLQYYSTQAQK